tara:strand:+ start:1205 stop:1420 length:216 start_codon:yes stop_codon:yes gene_type:complete
MEDNHNESKDAKKKLTKLRQDYNQLKETYELKRKELDNQFQIDNIVLRNQFQIDKKELKEKINEYQRLGIF